MDMCDQAVPEKVERRRKVEIEASSGSLELSSSVLSFKRCQLSTVGMWIQYGSIIARKHRSPCNDFRRRASSVLFLSYVSVECKFTVS